MSGLPLGILLRSGGPEAAPAALRLATGAAAIGREVVLFATGPGCHLLRHPAPPAADARDAVLRARGVAGVAVLLEAAAELGIRRIACDAGLRGELIDPATLAPGVEVAGVVTFLSAVGDGQLLSV